jgi:hypothetical protein
MLLFRYLKQNTLQHNKQNRRKTSARRLGQGKMKDRLLVRRRTLGLVFKCLFSQVTQTNTGNFCSLYYIRLMSATAAEVRFCRLSFPTGPNTNMAPILKRDLLASLSTIPNQIRSASALTLLTSPTASAPPLVSSLPNSRLSSIPHIDEWPAVRKSSIDLALFSLLSQPSQSRKSSEGSIASNLADIANLSSVAGPLEAAIRYLLKERQPFASQNAQLWQLVDT